MHKAFEQMIIQNQGRIRYIASRNSHANEFEDMYQEILMQLWRSFESFDGKSARETWVYKVALNTAYTYVRKSIKQKKVMQNMPPINISEPAQDNCQADILQSFMDKLNDIDASILMMYLDGLSSEDTADVVGITSNAVRARIKRIKQEFEHQYIEEPS